MNKIIFMLPLLVFGCDAEDLAYDGGSILYEESAGLPEPPEDIQQCEDKSIPYDWAPTACVAHKMMGECCYWTEQASAGESFRGEPIVTNCRYDWCWDKYQCEWIHLLTRCYG